MCRWSWSELRVRLVPFNTFKPHPSSLLSDNSKGVLLLWILLVSFLFVLVILSCMFLAALRSPVVKWLTLWLSSILWYSLVFVVFPHGVLGLVWNLIVSIPYIFLFPYLAIIFFLKFMNILGQCYVFTLIKDHWQTNIKASSFQNL